MGLFESNNVERGGSFYLQSKIVRAKEALEDEIKNDATDDAERPE